MKALFILLAMSALQAIAQPIEFKGIRPGESKAADVTAIYPGTDEHSERMLVIPAEVGAKMCGTYRYMSEKPECAERVRNLFEIPGGYRALHISFNLMSKGGVVGSIRLAFNSDAYEAMKDALAVKYGHPTKVQQSTLQNRMGAEFAAETATWSKADGVIVVRQRFAKVTEGVVEFLTNDITQKLEHDRRRQAEEGARKL